MGALVNCPSCATENPPDRSFCTNCGVALTAPAHPRPATAGRSDDVQPVELAYVPTVLHAPTPWTIAKGIFLGLLLWSAFSALVAGVVFAVLLNL